MANIIQTFPKGSGGGSGHTILDSEGTAVAQESKLQFKGVSVTDNSTDGITEFEGEGLNADSIDDIASANSVVPAVVIGDANNYSTTEKIIGQWTDGRPLYQKTVNCGTLPNNTNKTVSLSITNLENIISSDGIALTSGGSIVLPHVDLSANDSVQYYFDSDNVVFRTKNNYSGYTAYLTVKYIKTT